MRIDLTSWGTWQRAYRLTDVKVELIVVTEIGPRIVSFVRHAIFHNHPQVTLMNTMATVVVVLGLVTMAPCCAAGEPPAKRLWSVVLGTNTPSFTYDVRQIAADGSGGCALLHTRNDGFVVYYYVSRYNRKGALLWRTTFQNMADIDIVFCNKKYVVLCFQPIAGRKQIMTFDLKNNQTTTADSGVDYYNNTNDNGEYGGPGDKTGFFAVKFVTATGEYSLERRSYKPQK